MKISFNSAIKIYNGQKSIGQKTMGTAFFGADDKTDSLELSGQKGLTQFIRKRRLSPQDADRILLMNPELSRYLGNI